MGSETGTAICPNLHAEIWEGRSPEMSLTASYLLQVSRWHIHNVDQREGFLRGYLHVLNDYEPPIRFKYVMQKERIDFLDTTIFKNPLDNSQLLTKVFFKLTDIHQLLHKVSFHPKHTFKGLVKYQITRFFRICSNRVDFDEAAWMILFRNGRPKQNVSGWADQRKTTSDDICILPLVTRDYINCKRHLLWNRKLVSPRQHMQ